MIPLHIVIPTYNRADTLIQNLKAIEHQDLDRSFFSITVVDDGSVDNTLQRLKEIRDQLNFELHILTQKNQGAGAARNAAIGSRPSQYTLFIGDDIFPTTHDFFSRHLKAQQTSDQNTNFVGFTTWHPKLPYSRFRIWLENGGPQFDYRHLKDRDPMSYRQFYTSNISIPTQLLMAESFDSCFTGYGWEDIELGYRIVKNHHSQIIYLADAKAWHCHELEEADVWNRLPNMKEGGLYFEHKHPEMTIYPKGWKKTILGAVTASPIPQLLGLLKKEWEWHFMLRKKLYP
ncbi:MAG: glycosyltransferase family 2 protein [Chlamydiales bacterium]